MSIDDHEALIALLRETPGVTLREADSREATARYLERNPGLSFVATDGGSVIGCVLCGHDGRRGYLQHLVVRPAHQRRGIASALVERSLAELERLGIHKCHIDVLRSNDEARRWWERRGWALRDDIDRYSIVRGGAENA